MSLPTAPRDISEHPQTGAVTDPVNKKLKDADIDRKLRLYGVVEALRQGRMPDNQQIDQTLAFVRDHSPVDVSKLSREGKHLIQDVRDIVETARLIVANKNADELFQNFVWHTRRTDFSNAKTDPNNLIPVSGEQAKADGHEAAEHLRTLLSLVLTNSEARKLLSDFSIIGRDLLSRGAAKAAENIRPPDHHLDQVDKSAPNDKFERSHDGNSAPPPKPFQNDTATSGPDGRSQPTPFGHNEQSRVPDPNLLGSFGTNERSQAAPLGRSSRADPNRLGTDFDVDDSGDTDHSGTHDDPSLDSTAAPQKRGFRKKLSGMKDGLLDRLPQQHKDRVTDGYDRGTEFLSEQYFPEERRDQFIFRGKKVIVECQRHDDYQKSLRWLLDTFENYTVHSKTAASGASDHGAGFVKDSTLSIAFSELRTLLERFANGVSLEIIVDAYNTLYEDAQRDEHLRNWFKSVDKFIRKALLEPGYILEPDCNNEANRIRDSGHQFYDEKYKEHFDNLFNSIGTWFKAMGEDPLNTRFGEDWSRLTKDLLFDSEGSLKFKPELWNDIRRVILPTLIDQVGFVPIPRVEYTDDSLDLILENLTLSGRNLFPNIVSIEVHNFIKFSPYNNIKDEGHHDFTLTFSQVQADMRDVAFYFRKKTGIKIQDSGLADVVLGGEGLTVTAHLASSGKDKSSAFIVKRVNVKVDSLKFSIRDSKHDTLYNTLRPLATGLVKKQIQRALGDAIRTGLEYLDGQLVNVRDRMAEAKTSDDTNRTQVLQELFKRKQDEAASVKSNTNSQFKVVSKRDSVLIPEGHPSGWINRGAERQQAASTGKDWRSQAFQIV